MGETGASRRIQATAEEPVETEQLPEEILKKHKPSLIGVVDDELVFVEK